jgi:E3 ubiquitin-protein ligase HUWE1
MKVTLMLCIRRLIETPDVLSAAFKFEICHWFETKSRSVDVGNFVKQNLAIALKDPDLFIATTAELCWLPKYDRDSSLQLIERKAVQTLESVSADASMPDSSALENESLKSAEQLRLHHSPIAVLLSELQRTFSDFKEECRRPELSELRVESGSSERSKAPRFEPKDHPEYLYLCSILQCLTELLASYTRCKIEFIHYTEDITTGGCETNKKPQNIMLHYFLHGMTMDIIPVEGSTEDKLWHVVDGWAKSVIVALCADARDTKSDAEIILVRECTLDILHKSIRDTITFNSVTAIRYRHFVVYAELIQKLISSSVLPNSYTSSTQANETHKTIAKMMLERNFVGLLTTIVAEVDLRVPDSSKVIRAVMRPIRTLTKLANRLGDLVSPKLMDHAYEASTSDHVDFADGTNHEVDETVLREDTPDLYRNSALGMFGAELHESDEEAYDSDEDEEMYDHST